MDFKRAAQYGMWGAIAACVLSASALAFSIYIDRAPQCREQLAVFKAYVQVKMFLFDSLAYGIAWAAILVYKTRDKASRRLKFPTDSIPVPLVPAAAYFLLVIICIISLISPLYTWRSLDVLASNCGYHVLPFWMK